MKQYLNTTFAGVLAVCLLVVFYFACLNHVSPGEVGVANNNNNNNTGAVYLQTNTGWYATSPLVKVINIPITPQRVEFPVFANVVSQRIIRIRREHILELIERENYSYF